MKLSEFKQTLESLQELRFKMADGTEVPPHFHITEVGHIRKHYIDCGGKERDESFIRFQLWVSIDVDHRLSPKKLIGIIRKSERVIGLEDHEIEVEYQGDTIGKYSLSFKNDQFVLNKTFTECLAPDQCGVPSFQGEKPNFRIKKIKTS